MLNRMSNIKEKVKILLKMNPELRDDDNRLIANIYWKEGGGKERLSNMTAFEFLTEMATGKYTNFETIRRIRAKLQEDFPELRGKKYLIRKKMGTDISHNIKNL